MPTHIADYTPTENWGDDNKWTNAIMDAFSNALTTYLNDTLVETVNNGQSNIGAVAATTTTTNDSLKITGPDGVTLSTTNFDIELPSDTAQGRYERFTLSSDITLKISGAHWGLGTTGNVTGAILRWGFINDGGATPALWIGYLGNRETVASTSCFTTQTSVTAPEHLLVNRSLAVGTWPVEEFGYFYVDFNDTGDIWTIQSGIGKVFSGRSADSIPINWNPVVTGCTTTSPSAIQFTWYLVGKMVHVEYNPTGLLTSNATSFTITSLPIKPKYQENFNTGYGYDNGAALADPIHITTVSQSRTLTLNKNVTSAAWTSSNGKQAVFKIQYEAYYG